MTRFRRLTALFPLVVVLALSPAAHAGGACGNSCQSPSKAHAIVAPKGFYWDYVYLRRRVVAICDYENANAGANWTPEMEEYVHQMYVTYQNRHDALEKKLQKRGQPPIAPSIGDWVVAYWFKARTGGYLAMDHC